MVLEKLPLLLMSAANCVVTLIAQSRGDAVVSLTRHPLAARLATVVQAYCGYLGKMALPVNLAPIYPLPKTINYWAAIACANRPGDHDLCASSGRPQAKVFDRSAGFGIWGRSCR